MLLQTQVRIFAYSYILVEYAKPQLAIFSLVIVQTTKRTNSLNKKKKQQ